MQRKIHPPLMGFDKVAEASALCALGPVPTDADFQMARVTMANQSEAVRWRLYDYLLYPTAGVGQLNFFQTPVGQGQATFVGSVAGQNKTYADTNMDLAGQIASGAEMMVESIEVPFFPGSVATANLYTLAQLSVFNAAAAAAIAGSVNDVNTFYQSGFLEFKILQKTFVREAPLVTFPPKNTLSMSTALASNSATVGEIATVFARADGATYEIPGGYLLQPGVNFVVSLNWPAVVATPSGFNARVGVILDGWLKRSVQ